MVVAGGDGHPFAKTKRRREGGLAVDFSQKGNDDGTGTSMASWGSQKKKTKRKRKKKRAAWERSASAAAVVVVGRRRGAILPFLKKRDPKKTRIWKAKEGLHTHRSGTSSTRTRTKKVLPFPPPFSFSSLLPLPPLKPSSWPTGMKTAVLHHRRRWTRREKC